jgi:hypothetical protein
MGGTVTATKISLLRRPRRSIGRPTAPSCGFRCEKLLIVAPEEEPKPRQPEYTLYGSRRRTPVSPEEEPKRRSVGDLIIRAGAVAAAIGSIVTVVALVWPDSPARQGAKLDNVSHERNVSLAEFAARQEIAALNPGAARGRSYQHRGIGPPTFGVVLLPSADVPPDGVDTVPEGPDTAPPEDDSGTETPEDGSGTETPEDGAGTETPKDDKPARRRPRTAPATPQQQTQRALDSVIPPGYNLNPTCNEGDPSCSPPEEIPDIVVGGNGGAAGGDGGAPTEREALQAARRLLRVLRSTRVRTSPSASASGGNQEVLGVTVNFDLQLEGFEGRRSEVRWSLYDARGNRRVPRDWLINRRVLSLKGKANEDRVSKEFWVPLPKRKGPFFVRVGAYDDQGNRMTYEDTKTFAR